MDSPDCRDCGSNGITLSCGPLRCRSCRRSNAFLHSNIQRQAAISRTNFHAYPGDRKLSKPKSGLLRESPVSEFRECSLCRGPWVAASPSDEPLPLECTARFSEG